jgi:hypothetical protein
VALLCTDEDPQADGSVQRRPWRTLARDVELLSHGIKANEMGLQMRLRGVPRWVWHNASPEPTTTARVGLGCNTNADAMQRFLERAAGMRRAWARYGRHMETR